MVALIIRVFPQTWKVLSYFFLPNFPGYLPQLQFWRGYDTGHPCLHHILVGRLGYLWVFIKAIRLSKFPYLPSVLTSIMKGIAFCQMIIFCIYWNDHVGFVLYSIIMVYYTHWFSDINPTLYSWDKSQWVTVYNYF